MPVLKRTGMSVYGLNPLALFELFCSANNDMRLRDDPICWKHHFDEFWLIKRYRKYAGKD